MIYYDTDSIKTDEKHLVKMQKKAWAYWKAMDEAIRALEEKLMKEAMENEESIHHI